MRNVRFIFSLVLLVVATVGSTQGNDVIQNYIDTYREIAIEEMQRTGVPAAIKLAQGIHETTAGTSELVRKSNNHFGIKCKSNWLGESVRHTDDAPHECFRKYDDPFQSYRDHSDFLKGSTRYASLFNLDPLDYSGWAYGLKKAGYATNPRYPQIIIKLIETWHLQDYTMIALGKMSSDSDIARTSSAGSKTEVVVAVASTPAPVQRPSYPKEEFKINNTRVIYATAGTSVLAIAKQYDVPLARIFEFNELGRTETLEKDQLIFLQRKRKSGSSDFHIVKQGETIWGIAQEEGIRLESLLEYNHLESYMQPAAGEQLYLRTKAPGAPRLAKNEVDSNRIVEDL
jgi:LysM repeat protein